MFLEAKSKKERLYKKTKSPELRISFPLGVAALMAIQNLFFVKFIINKLGDLVVDSVN